MGSSRSSSLPQVFQGDGGKVNTQKQQSPRISARALFCMGTRRTVCFGEVRFFGCLEFVGKFGVPQLVTINKSASYGVQWNRTRLFLKCRMLLAYKAIIQNCLWNSKPPDTERCRSLLPLRIGRIAQKEDIGSGYRKSVNSSSTDRGLGTGFTLLFLGAKALLAWSSTKKTDPKYAYKGEKNTWVPVTIQCVI
jgi:hypothetical protein